MKMVWYMYLDRQKSIQKLPTLVLGKVQYQNGIDEPRVCYGGR